MLSELPQSLIQAVEQVGDVLESCIDCGAVIGSCIHSDSLSEDSIMAQDVPSDDEPEDELSGEKEEVVINPEYQIFSRHPQKR